MVDGSTRCNERSTKVRYNIPVAVGMRTGVGNRKSLSNANVQIYPVRRVLSNRNRAINKIHADEVMHIPTGPSIACGCTGREKPGS